MLGDEGKSRYWLEVLGVGIFGSPFHFLVDLLYLEVIGRQSMGLIV